MKGGREDGWVCSSSLGYGAVPDVDWLTRFLENLGHGLSLHEQLQVVRAAGL